MHPLTDYIPSLIFVVAAFAMPSGTIENEPLTPVALNEGEFSVISPIESPLDGQASEGGIPQFKLEAASETNSAGVELTASSFY